jgi:signal transduction histidine kinase/DNA-binding response OmpR family regulator
MPGMDGLETAELIRARRKSAHTPIIFITAFADEMHTARGYSLGAVDYILSPVVPNILRSKVKALVQLHRLNAELKKRSDERVALVKEQAARSMAEESQRRASFLAEATQVMASSLDVDTILKGASGLVVPFLADYGAIALVNEDGSVRAQRSSSVAGWNPYMGAHAAAFDEKVAQVRTRAIERGTPEGATRLADDGPAGEIHAFPLVTRGKARGALLLALGPSSRTLAGADLSLADSLAGRAASALENCMLYEEIQRVDQRKNEFLATLSHELRNPLAPMRAALHMLRGRSVDPDKSRSLLETMDRQVAQMTRLVEDLLDISRITRGAIELRRETLEVGAEVRNAIESCQGQIEVGGHAISVKLPKEPLYVVADRVRMQQILENLILNACKYTEHGGAIEVSAEATIAEAVIRVTDNGIGIAPEKLSQVWELFVQVDESPERIRKGLGIGLALVRDLVRRHGGTVEATSEGLGRGSVFTVRLPRAVRVDIPREKAPPQVVAQPAPAHAQAGKRVLIVDDNIDACETLAMMLELLGQQTRQAHEGNGALKAAQEYNPELIFMDIGLPGLTGHEVVERMRGELGMKDTYIVALSGYGTEEDRRKSLVAGFDNHFVKPLDPSTLPSVLAECEKRCANSSNAMMSRT